VVWACWWLRPSSEDRTPQRLAGLTVADLADHVLYLGPRRDLTSAVPDWELFHELTCWAERNLPGAANRSFADGQIG
jgi:hypothetical protein